MNSERVIFHVDMDAFFAAVEQLDNPDLRGKPVLVGSDSPRGVVATASYEAREFGCHSAQPMAIAKRKCPQAVITPVRGARYGEVSAQIFEIFDRYSPLVEPLSIDEAFLDMTGTVGIHGPPREAATKLKAAIADEISLTASVGIAPNKFLAKLASDLQKPDGLTILSKNEIEDLLPSLPIRKIWGIGPVTAGKMESLGIKKIGDIRTLSLEWLEKQIGSTGRRYFNLARGIDDRPVIPDRDAKSISHEQTFQVDVEDPVTVRAVLMGQVEQVARRLRKHGFLASTVTVKIRYGDFKTITRRATLDGPTHTTSLLWKSASELYDGWVDQGYKPVRLVGMGAGGFAQSDIQQPLFPDPSIEREREIDEATDRIVGRFGKGSIQRGATLESKPAKKEAKKQ